MKPLKRYLIKAFYDWLTDSLATPHILVDATIEGVVVPLHMVIDGCIVINMRFQAIADLSMGDTTITFKTRFSGVATSIVVPYDAILAIYAKESGDGIVFDSITPDVPQCPVPEVKKPMLTLVK